MTNPFISWEGFAGPFPKTSLRSMENQEKEDTSTNLSLLSQWNWLVFGVSSSFWFFLS